MICRIKYIHTKRFIHSDIKPDNIVMGTGRLGDLVHVIDFGVSREYVESLTKKHRPYREDVTPIGTPAFMSISTHLGIGTCETKM